MAEERTYLELSEEGEGSHKFYEVIVKDETMTIRYGRIGDAGRTSSKKLASFEAAKKEAAKKIKSKTKKGYEVAVMGVRKKRAITRRTITSTRSTSKKAPVLWRFRSGNDAFGIFIDNEAAWVGNESGNIFVLNHQGEVQRQFKLPDGVKAIVADGEWIYAGCDNGSVYDLTGKVPRIAYEISENVDIYWIDINNALLGVADSNGTVIIANHEDEDLWEKKSSGSSGWMVRCDDECVYHGHSRGVTAYIGRDDAEVKWETSLSGSVLFGWQEANTVYAGTSASQVYTLDKADGKILGQCKCDGGVFSCATSKDGEYIFAGDSSSSIYCFDATGKRLWKLGTGCGSAYSMQYHDQKVYIVTTDGSLACIDASETAIKSAQEGTVPEERCIKAPKAVSVIASTTMESIKAAELASKEGVVVRCVKEGSKLRIYVVGNTSECTLDGNTITATQSSYNQGWHVQFPKDIRKDGACYLVDEVKAASNGGFYRAKGNIQEITL